MAKKQKQQPVQKDAPKKMKAPLPKMSKKAEAVEDAKDPLEGKPSDDDYAADSFEAQSAAQQLIGAQKVKMNKGLHNSAKVALKQMASHAKRAAR